MGLCFAFPAHNLTFVTKIYVVPVRSMTIFITLSSTSHMCIDSEGRMTGVVWLVKGVAGGGGVSPDELAAAR